MPLHLRYKVLTERSSDTFSAGLRVNMGLSSCPSFCGTELKKGNMES